MRKRWYGSVDFQDAEQLYTLEDWERQLNDLHENLIDLSNNRELYDENDLVDLANKAELIGWNITLVKNSLKEKLQDFLRGEQEYANELFNTNKYDDL